MECFQVTYDEYREAMRELGRLMHMDPLKITASELAQIDALAIPCEAYEKEHFPVEKPTPEEAAAFRREQEANDCVYIGCNCPPPHEHLITGPQSAEYFPGEQEES